MSSHSASIQAPGPFNNLEDKSLEQIQDENKGASTPPPAPGEVKDTDVEVEMIHHGTYDGKDLVPGQTYRLPQRVALGLVTAMRARNVS